MAIVLPNGLLNNPGLTFFRHAILEKAQLLAVVDMHRDLFQPHNDTQTSMVLLRKWSEGEGAGTHGDYPIFMAIADAVGHNKRGKTIYKRQPDGSVMLRDVVIKKSRVLRSGEEEQVLVRSQQPVVNDELDDVAETYLSWLERLSALRRGRRGGAA